MTVQSLKTFNDKKLPLSSLNENNTNFTAANIAAIPADSINLSPAASGLKEAKKLKELGNECIKREDYHGAIRYYKQSIKVKPNYVDAYYNLGKAYKTIGDFDNAAFAYEKLVHLQPRNTEAITNIGQCYKQKKEYSRAMGYFKNVLEINPKFDLASRELKETEYLQIKQVSPQFAQIRKYNQSKKNLENALGLVKKHFPPEIINQVKGITFVFGPTSALGGHSNIAQYENYNKKIVVTDRYIWAAPEIVAAYLVHEVIHGKDNDPYTSIKEEQDAYEESVKFWINFNKGIRDPEMDYAAMLYKENPKKLAAKVAEIYSTRDGSIPEFSPNHGIPSKSLSYSLFKIKNVFCKILPVSSKAAELAIISDNRLYSKYYK